MQNDIVKDLRLYMGMDNPLNSVVLCAKGDWRDWNKLCDQLHKEGRKHTRTISIECRHDGIRQINHRVYDDDTLLYFCCGDIQIRPIIINQTT
jgi:hypothetical protein